MQIVDPVPEGTAPLLYGSGLCSTICLVYPEGAGLKHAGMTWLITCRWAPQCAILPLVTSSTTIQREYRILRDEIAALLEKGRLQAVRSVSEIVTRTYWKVGRLLARVPALGENRNTIAFISKLAGELGVSASMLYHSLRFYRAYPAGLPQKPDAARLAWGSHVALLPIKDIDERLFYIGLAVDQGWSRKELKRAVRGGLYARNAGGAGAKITAPLRTRYRTLKKRGPLRSAENRGGLLRPCAGMHTYVGLVEKIVSGDTLDVRIDLGFNFWEARRIRLRGVEAPGMNREAGRAARRFVAETLSAVDFVVLMTYKTDNRSRYIADVFYDPAWHDKESIFDTIANQVPHKPRTGLFLNRELLDQGHAVPEI